MRAQPRRQPPPDTEALDLLEELIATPPAAGSRWGAPVALRSTEEQRRHALSGYLLRTWVDGVLHHAERLLAVGALIVFGYWAYDGPARDWMHARSARPPVAVAAPARPAPAAAPARAAEPPAAGQEGAAPLPFTTPAMADTSEDEGFIAPRSSLPAPEVEHAPQPTELQIPAIGLETSVREVFVVDGAWEVADYAAGYMHGTSLPGEVGTMALAGHAGLRGGVFRDLGALKAGDDVLVDAAGWRYRYRVRDSMSVWPTQTDVLAPAQTPVLILITCTNWDTQRLIVRADLVESKPIPGA